MEILTKKPFKKDCIDCIENPDGICEKHFEEWNSYWH